MNTRAHLEPLPLRLHAIHLSLEGGHANLKPFGAHLERGGTLIVLNTTRGPAYVNRATLPAIVAKLTGGAPPRVVVRDPAPLEPARPAECYPLEKTFAYQDPDRWPKKFKPGCAPARAVGNFTTPEDAERTLQFARENVLQARKSGNAKLLAVMVDALERIQKRN